MRVYAPVIGWVKDEKKTDATGYRSDRAFQSILWRSATNPSPPYSVNHPIRSRYHFPTVLEHI
jgi:hypothetical protein